MTSIQKKHMPDAIKRIARTIGYALLLDDVNSYHGVSVVLTATASPRQRMALAWAVLRSLTPDQIVDLSQKVLPDGTSAPVAPLFNHMDEAAWWADMAEPEALEAYNLEDTRDELDRRIIAAMQHHNVTPDEINGRLCVDTGRERTLSTAIQTRDGIQIIKPEMEALAQEIAAREIDVLVIDPFVPSHQVSENDNGAIDLVAKEWARLADHCNCAIELVHHTRKTNGEEATTESAWGATALLGAARSGRVLNKMSDELKAEAGVQDDPATYFSITRDKANLAPAGKRQWRRMESVHLANGDSVGVAEVWEWPDTFDGITVKDLLNVQHAIDGKDLRYSDQAKNGWAGIVVAEATGLDAVTDRKRIKKIIETWIKNGALVKGKTTGSQRKSVVTLEIGEWATE